MDDRIKYFKKIGIDLGDNYNDYVNNVECKKICSKQEVIDYIIKKREYFVNAFNKEFYESLPRYQKTQNSIDLLLDREVFTYDTYQNPITCVSPNIKLENGLYKEQNLVLINVNANDEYLDKNIIHEFNHLLELNLNSVSENTCQMICGWDLLDNNVQKQGKRNYELFNEIVNETIAQEISELMHQQGIFIFNSKEDFRDFGGTNYQKSYCIVKELLENYKSKIIESRRNGKIEIIFDAIGKENFESLNVLVNEFNNTFPNSEYYTLMDDLSEQKDTILTRKYNEIMKQKDIIYEQIKVYSNARTM